MENTPVHSPIPAARIPYARQIMEKSPQMPGYVPAERGGSAGVYIDWCISFALIENGGCWITVLVLIEPDDDFDGDIDDVV